MGHLAVFLYFKGFMWHLLCVCENNIINKYQRVIDTQRWWDKRFNYCCADKESPKEVHTNIADQKISETYINAYTQLFRSRVIKDLGSCLASQVTRMILSHKGRKCVIPTICSLNTMDLRLPFLLKPFGRISTHLGWVVDPVAQEIKTC